MGDDSVRQRRTEIATQLALVLEAAPQGVVVTDDSGNIVLVNAELERMFGHTRSTLLGRSIEQLLPERFRTGHIAMRTRYLASPSPRAMGAGRELYGLRADGSEFPVQIGLNAVRTDDGWLSIAALADVTERTRAERAFRNVVNAAPYGLLLVDEEGAIVMANARVAASFGYSIEELVGSSLETLIPDRYRPSHPKLRAHYVAHPELRSMGAGRDLVGRHKDGTEFPVEVGLSPVDWHGKPMALAAVIDITVRKGLELELRQANANLEEFTYVASHDLKSPLRGISDLVEWLLEDLAGAGGPEVQKNLSRVQIRIRRMEGIIDDLLAYARAGRPTDELTVVEPRSLIENILELQPRPAEFRFRVAVEAEPFKAARVPLETVLRNLISNAVKHHDRADGQIEIRVVEADSFCRFTVTDDGPGIPAKAHARVFKLFQTVSAAERNGSGVGLALTKRLVECHGGSIRLESSDQTRGATFEVCWPRFQRRSMHEQL